jgi:hypothetical protein
MTNVLQKEVALTIPLALRGLAVGQLLLQANDFLQDA